MQRILNDEDADQSEKMPGPFWVGRKSPLNTSKILDDTPYRLRVSPVQDENFGSTQSRHLKLSRP